VLRFILRRIFLRFSGDAILVLYEPDRSFMHADAPPKPESGIDLPAMRNAAQRAVAEGLKALFDDYTVTAEELGDFESVDVGGSQISNFVKFSCASFGRESILNTWCFP
jgi:hypothetical protein